MSSAPSVHLVRFAGEQVSFAPGEAVFSQGDPGDKMYVVKDGEVEIRIRDRILETVGAGGLIGEMALVDHQPRSAAAVARTACTLVPIDETRFKFLVQQTPFFAIEVMRVMVHRLRRLNAQV